MTVFNQTFFDLNGKRGYCFDRVAALPPDTLSDLKLSVPNSWETVWLCGLFLHGESVRLTFTTLPGSRRIATFTSDRRSSLRPGEPYPLHGCQDGYGGLIVFGEAVRTDCDLRVPLRVSEECLTRYEMSSIPYAALSCRNERLTGEVHLAGNDRLLSDGVNTPQELLGTTRALRLALIDTGTADKENPMLAMLNGINGDYGLDGISVRWLFGAVPDTNGTVTFMFDEHFHFAPTDDPSVLALGTDFSTDEICGGHSESSEELFGAQSPCPPSGITFDRIPYQ